MYTATKDKIDVFHTEIQWYDKDDNHRGNKDRMKETSRMLSGYRQKLNELIIIGIAKSLEDTLYDMKEKLNNDINFWKDCEDFMYYNEMKKLRNLNNYIKHSKGIIKRGHPSNDYLIDNAGFTENSKIDNLNLNLEKYIMQSFLFQMEIFWNKDLRDNPYTGIKDDEKSIRKILIPEFIETNN
ncbi:hypothetical protein [Tenacibaculum geojense]|uniref:Uncharacterized protein n=1 Tax=Tenacibaculum geojense TaxID=915352 RepID=A0ABW3JQS7_9FLAO